MSLMNNKNKNKFQWQSYHRAMTKRGFMLSFQTNLEYALAKDQFTSTKYDKFMALAYSLRDRIVERWIQTQQRYHKENVKRVYYLSLEFLIGRTLKNHVYNLGVEKQIREALHEMGMDLDELCDQEMEAGLGNGGLGRLAACFLESLATLSLPAQGYGIRYDYGIFHQQIVNGYQIEMPDEWLKKGYPWEFCRPEYTKEIKFYGRSECYSDANGRPQYRWVDTQDVLAVPYDMPIVGYKNNVVNTLRLWSARSSEEFDLSYFNEGDYEQAVYKKILTENISKVLYPNDALSQGRELRLKQEYFFTAASIADILRRYKIENSDLTKLSDKAVIQLNDTHPALAIPELMRVFIDEECMEWDQAWNITRKVFDYTNHTLLPEALECWSIDLLKKVLPRHLEIIYEINHRFLEEVDEHFPGDGYKRERMSLIQEGMPKKVRMANLSIIASSRVNGVSQLHTDLLKQRLFPEFNEFYPDKFVSKTNGITHRRWLLVCNQPLSNLITDSIGEQWVYDLMKLKKLESYKDDTAFQERWQDAKLQNKRALSKFVDKTLNISIDPQTMFDVQVKRIHEYKRQLMFALYIFSQYLEIKNNPNATFVPRTFIIGGKAAPGYYMAKLIIKFINSIADMVNSDPVVHPKMKLVFLENYRVTMAEKIMPASNLSEQISTAGMEASGTGNMKFMLNGALTIGTLDGANIEISESVGRDNIFIFGMKANEVQDLQDSGYNPMEYVEHSPVLKEIYNLLIKNYLCPNQIGMFDPILKTLFQSDQYMICADFDSYCQTQARVSELYTQKADWTRKSILNVASSGPFSSDRTIKEYADEIWDLKPLKN